MTKTILTICALLLIAAFTACKKKEDAPKLSSQKQITAFILKATDNAGILSHDISGTIRNDSVVLAVASGTNVTHLIPVINFEGKTMLPQSGVEQNFSSPVIYTVTAEDGSTRQYVAVVRFLSSEKEITSFVFKITVVRENY